MSVKKKHTKEDLKEKLKEYFLRYIWILLSVVVGMITVFLFGVFDVI